MGNPNPYALIKPKPVKVRIKKPVLIGLALLWLLTIDFFTRVPAGPVSVSGALTLAGAMLCLFAIPRLLAARAKRAGGIKGTKLNGRGKVPIVLTLFILYALVRLIMLPEAEGLQNVAVYTTFVVAIGLTSMQISSDASFLLMRWMRYVAVIASLAYLLTFLAGVQIYSDRAYALTGLVFLAILIPHKPGNRLYRLAPFLVAGTIALSLSRTATAIALVLLVFLSVRGRRGYRMVLSGIMAGTAVSLAYWLFTSYAPLRDRFLGGDNGASIGNVELNTSGRTRLWEITQHSAEQHPEFGRGPGSATALIKPMFRDISHPHNEYLRLFHDFGYVGAALFIIGMLLLLTRVWRRAHHSENPVHWAAVLGLLSVMAAALTDNVIIYPFVMVPLGVLVGASLGLPVETRPQREVATRVPYISPAYKRLQAETTAAKPLG